MNELYTPTLFDTPLDFNSKRPSKPVVQSKPQSHTKTASYLKTQQDAGSKRKQVLDCIQQHGPIHMRLIEEHTGLLRSSICGRVNELRKAGLVYELPNNFYDPVTDRTVNQYAVVIRANSNA